MARSLTWLGGLVVLLGLLGSLYTYLGLEPGTAPFTLEEVDGGVALGRDGVEAQAQEGVALRTGDRVRTDAEAYAILSREGGSPIRLEGNTQVQVLAVDEGMLDLELERGQVRARVRPDAGAVRLTSEGRGVLATDADLAMAVDTDAGLAVEVDQGRVSVQGVSGVFSVDAGQRLVAARDGEGVVRDIPEELLLDVAWPEPGRVEEVTVVGQTEPGSRVRLVRPGTSEVVHAGLAGRFALPVVLAAGDNEVELAVTDPFGRSRRVTGRVRRLTDAPGLTIDLDYERR